MAGGNKRLNLSIADGSYKKLVALKELTESDSLAEVIRRALAVYDCVIREQVKGSAIHVVESNGDEKRLILP